MSFPKDEILEVAKAVCVTFTIEYTKAYTLALVQQIKEEMNAPPEPDWQLEKRPKWEKDLKTGWLVKEGAIRKSWKRRWFVVKPDYQIDYYAEETDLANKKKPKGSINLCGYWVNTDPNDSVIGRLKRLAEKMGMDFSNLPKPNEYPPLTFELYHWRRRCYYVTASTKEEFDDWVAQFRSCCWWARGLQFDDGCHRAAFPVAAQKTRWELGRWGWYSSYGTEEQIMCEMIADELDYEIMGRVFGQLVGPWFIRSMLRNKVQKAIDALVMGAVKSAWAAMKKAVEELRPQIEPKIRELVEPIFAAEKDIVDKIKDKVMSTILPIQEEHVNPHLRKIIDIVRKPVSDGFNEVFKLYDEKINKWEPTGADLSKTFNDLDWFPRSYWQMRPATDKAEEMYQSLDDLRIIFKDIYPWSLCNHATSSIRDLTDNAIWTWQQAILAQGADRKPEREVIDRIKYETMEKFRHDADIAITRFSAKVMKLILLPPFEALVNPAAKLIIAPIAETIPGPVKQFIDIQKDFEDLYNGILDDAINSAIQHAHNS